MRRWDRHSLEAHGRCGTPEPALLGHGANGHGNWRRRSPSTDEPWGHSVQATTTPPPASRLRCPHTPHPSIHLRPDPHSERILVEPVHKPASHWGRNCGPGRAGCGGGWSGVQNIGEAQWDWSFRNDRASRRSPLPRHGGLQNEQETHWFVILFRLEMASILLPVGSCGESG